MLSDAIARTATVLDQALEDDTALTALTHRNLIDVLYHWRSEVRELEEKADRLDAILSATPTHVPDFRTSPRLVVDNQGRV